MGYIVEVKYFNTFLLKRVMNQAGSRGHWPNLVTATAANNYPTKLQFNLDAGTGGISGQAETNQATVPVGATNIQLTNPSGSIVVGARVDSQTPGIPSFTVVSSITTNAQGDITGISISQQVSQNIPNGTVLNFSFPISENNWAIEESRIRGGYNNTSTDYGVKAYLVEEEPNAALRGNSLIYSGIFNSRTGINQTNVFNVGEEITKSADPANGTIQKLYAEDTNLIIFQENKVSRALIDKDAIYNAEGGGNVTSVNTTIGTIQPYAGNYGISNNPESFAVYGYRKYFTDKDRNAVLRLSMDGITEISNYGMYDYFRDQLSSLGTGKAIGGWDIHNKMYTVSLQYSTAAGETTKTLAFDEQVKGWPSFFDYKPDNLFWLNNGFYSTTGQYIYKHYSNNVNPGNFYGYDNKSSITFIFNPKVSLSKLFKTINYEGDSGWAVSNITTSENDTGNSIYSYTEGAYDSSVPPVTGNAAFSANANQPIRFAGFMKQEGKYKAEIKNSSSATYGEIRFGVSMTGVKGYYSTVTIETDSVTSPSTVKELFAVSSEYVESYY